MKNKQSHLGVLYIVATPIGNRDDVSCRAIETLKQVSCIYCEDTRHSKPLLQYCGIDTKLKSLHEHNEADRIVEIEDQLQQGLSLALISDAGTPLISDPGYLLVKALREKRCVIQTIPGPSALIAALSIAGVATDRFCFEGFLPAKSKARQDQLKHIQQNTSTVVCYESSHRIDKTLNDIALIMPDRDMVLCKELTKQFETAISGKPVEVIDWLNQDSKHSNGEFVLIFDKLDLLADQSNNELIQTNLDELIRLFGPHCGKSGLAKALSQLTGQKRQDIYQRCLDVMPSS